jgi:hypothetical protein
MTTFEVHGKKIEGLFEHGYSAQTFRLADQLHRDEEARQLLRKWLDCFDTPIRYSNEDFDRKQGLASDLADIIRK